MFKFIGYYFREIFGVRRCTTIEALCDYMEGKTFEDLAAWLDWQIEWTKDETEAQRWEPVAVVLARNKNGKIKCNCQEIASIAHTVATLLGWGVSNIICLKYPKPPGHAICVSTVKKEIVIVDKGRVLRLPLCYGDSGAIRKYKPETIYYVPVSSRGISIGERVYL